MKLHNQFWQFWMSGVCLLIAFLILPNNITSFLGVLFAGFSGIFYPKSKE